MRHDEDSRSDLDSIADLESARAAIDWADPAPDRPVPFWRSLRLDVIAHVPPADRGGSRWRNARRAARIVAFSTGFHVTFLHRASHQAAHRGGIFGRAVAGFLFWVLRHVYGCAIAPKARIHGGLILPHPQGIVIGHGAEIGPRAWIFQNVTLGGVPGRAGFPRVGRDARVFSGAVLTGPIRLGDSVMVGANAVVARDVPSRTLVRLPRVEMVALPEEFISRPETEPE